MWVGKKVSFEDESGEGSVAFEGTITDELRDQVFVTVSDHPEQSGWMKKIDLEVND